MVMVEEGSCSSMVVVEMEMGEVETYSSREGAHVLWVEEEIYNSKVVGMAMGVEETYNSMEEEKVMGEVGSCSNMEV